MVWSKTVKSAGTWSKTAKSTGSPTKVAKSTGSWDPLRLLSYLLQETGEYLLQEDTTRIALEWAWGRVAKGTGSWSKIAKSTE